MKIEVPRSQIRHVITDLKKWQIRHKPFRRLPNGIEIELYPTNKSSFLLLKYNDIELDADTDLVYNNT